MRREQVFKCVLNHAITPDMEIKPMKQSDKAFVWATQNYADESGGAVESLSVRFKNASSAQNFELKYLDCVTRLRIDTEND